MRGKIQISVHQAMIYQVSIVLGTALLFVPSITTKFARQDAWISVILALLGGWSTSGPSPAWPSASPIKP